MAGRNYAQNFSLPGTESQHALDLLKSQFPAQSGDVDTIVFHTANGTVDDPAVQSAIEGVLAKVQNDPHVVSVLSPYSTDGSVEISRDRRTAFATINYDKPANQVPNAAGKPVLDQIAAVECARPEGGRRRAGDGERRGLHGRPRDRDRSRSRR